MQPHAVLPLRSALLQFILYPKYPCNYPGNINRYYYFIFAAVASNCITGPYGLITPILLGLLNFYAPFTDEKYHKF